MNLLEIVRRALPVVPRAEGDCIPWNDPEFSRRMLAVHLSEHTDLASRRSDVIDAHVTWLDEEVLHRTPSRVLDLGCGPGLYLQRLARRGHQGVGVDFGPASIAHARQEAKDLPLVFVEADLRDADFGEGFDLVTFIYGQLNVLSRAEAAAVVGKARAALNPSGRIVVEAQTLAAVRGDGETSRTWSTEETGLFGETPHLVLHERGWDPQARSTSERWYVIDASSGEVTPYAQTTEAYRDAELAALLESAGFVDVRAVGPLPRSPEGEALCAWVGTAE